MADFEPRKFFGFLNIFDGSARAKLYIQIILFMVFFFIAYKLFLQPQYQQRQTNTSDFSHANVREIHYETIIEKNDLLNEGTVGYTTNGDFNFELSRRF